MRSLLTLRQRFFRKVDQDHPTGCWVWMGSRNQEGYGNFWDGERVTKAHRFSYEMENGPIPEGCEIDHLCSAPPCVHPAHLEAVPHRTNILRGNAYAAQQARRTHCIRGHELAGENAYVYPTKNGVRRLCRVCRKLRSRGLIGVSPRWRRG